MEPVLQMNMLKLKQGKFTKFTESSVYCKLYHGMAGEPPQIHCFEKQKSTEPESVLKVKSLSCVEKHNQVPKVVKARYENYLLVRGVGGQEMYLRTETRQQRDEWFDQLQRLLDHSQAGRYVELSRTRRNTENAQSRPPPRTDPRGKGSVKSSPASAQGIFKQELEQKVQSVRNSKLEQIADSEHKCCPCHHREIGHDGQEPVYQNIHWVKDLQQFHRDSNTSREALKQSADLYNDFHRIASLQSQVPEEDEYEPVYYGKPPGAEQSLEQRFSGVSVNSEEDSQEGPLPLRSLEPRKVPVEQSWPPSEPGSPSEEQEPSSACSNAFRLELEGKLNSRRLSTGLPQCTVPEPEASLCLPSPEEGRVDESYRDPTTMEAVYQNLPSRPTSRLRRANALPSKRQPPPPLPRPRQASESERKAKKLLKEKRQDSVEMGIPKEAMMRHGLGLRAVNDSILVTAVPPALKSHLFGWRSVGDG
ncbi:uncharacterized protein [Diadema antillarum]|uniref:uncharacterized protein n=1 Tax=Diadema antillarum TaxID=105358 RepID=UPI003A850836